MTSSFIQPAWLAWGTRLAALSTLMWAAMPGAGAAVSTQEAATLKTLLTPMGAERAGSKDGVIPAWDDKPPPLQGAANGAKRPDPFAADKPILTITAANAAAYADKLNDGTRALLSKYPSFRLEVFPTRRSAVFPPAIYEAVMKNATQAKSSSDGLTVEGAVGGIPFPVPKTGYEAMWNHMLSFRGQVETFTADTYMVPPSGDPVLTARTLLRLAYPYYEPGRDAKSIEEWSRARLDTKEPPVQAGQSLLAIEYLDELRRPKDAWMLLPGQRRVRKAPSLTYDTPDAQSNGLNNFDDVYLFIGSMDRYDMKLLGKREMYVPYNNNGLALQSLSTVMGKGTLNPSAVRWELHRVWVVEATLLPGKRNVAARRKLYLDEDTWQAVLSDTWDGQGKIWKTGEAFTLVFPEQPSAATLPYAVYDLQSGAWAYTFSFNAVNSGVRFDRFDGNTLADFTPSALSGGSAR
jgi:hypothetical protein